MWLQIYDTENNLTSIICCNHRYAKQNHKNNTNWKVPPSTIKKQQCLTVLPYVLENKLILFLYGFSNPDFIKDACNRAVKDNPF